jgi:hypothetical protein
MGQGNVDQTKKRGLLNLGLLGTLIDDTERDGTPELPTKGSRDHNPA